MRRSRHQEMAGSVQLTLGILISAVGAAFYDWRAAVVLFGLLLVADEWVSRKGD